MDPRSRLSRFNLGRQCLQPGRARGVFFAIVVALALLAPDALAQRRHMTPAQMEAQAKRYKVGQWVEFEYFGKWEAAEVTKIDGSRVYVRTSADRQIDAGPGGHRRQTAPATAAAHPGRGGSRGPGDDRQR